MPATLVGELLPMSPVTQASGQNSRPRLYRAFFVYGLIALLAGFTLDGKFRIVVWIFVSGLAIKTWLAWMQQRR